MVTKPIRVAVWQHLVQQVQCVSVLFLNTGRKLAVIAERNMAPEICHKHSRHCQGNYFSNYLFFGRWRLDVFLHFVN